MGSLSSFSLPVVESSAASSPCAGCHAGCCRAYAVPLTGRDIFRIVTEKKVPFWKFVCRWADPSGRIAQDIAPHFCFDDDRQTPYVIALLQTESRNFPGTRKCVFLNETEPAGGAPRGTGRCAIYENRPVACRVFPARLDEAGDLAVHAVPEPSGEPGHAAYQLCPRPWSVADLDADEALKNLHECAREMDLFHAVARRWNDGPGPWPLFPDYLELIYTALAA
jgi:Fe-S-cluster containining protein